MNTTKYTRTNGLGMLQIAVRSSSSGVARNMMSLTKLDRILSSIF